jgi:hypothetical protein
VGLGAINVGWTHAPELMIVVQEGSIISSRALFHCMPLQIAMTLWALLQKFRRHYRWTSDAHRPLRNRGPLLLQIQGNKIHDDQFEIHAEHQTPDQEFTPRLAVLMYPLLDPESETYWQHILAGLEKQFRDEIPQAL